MTQHEQSKHFCMKCGYQLVGPPLPTRCSECGYPIVYQARWREGELHLAGPTIVWPVAKRFVLATALLFFSVVVSILCYSDVLLQMKLVGFSTARWVFFPFFIVAPIVTMLWQTSINGPGSDLWSLHRQASFRKWVLPCGAWFWIVAYLFVVDLTNGANPTNANSLNTKQVTAQWHDVVTLALVPALVGWLIVLLHLARVSLYLRNELPHRVWMFVAWLFGLGGLIILVVSSVRNSVEYFEIMLWLFTMILFFIGTLISVLVTWDMVNCLTHSYENMAREERLEKQNSQRYSAPK